MSQWTFPMAPRVMTLGAAITFASMTGGHSGTVEENSAAAWAVATLGMADAARLTFPQPNENTDAAAVDETSYHAIGGEHSGLGLWTGLSALEAAGDADGGSLQATAGVEYNFGQGAVGAYAAYTDTLIEFSNTSFSSEAQTVGAYFSYGFGADWRLGGTAYTGQSETTQPGGFGTFAHTGAELELSRGHMIGSVNAESFASAGWAQGELAAAGGSIEGFDASIGSRMVFSMENGAVPYALFALDYHAASSVGGASVNHVSPRIGGGVTLERETLDLQLHLEHGASFDGLKTSSIGLGINAEF